jgi:hypothetical protein
VGQKEAEAILVSQGRVLLDDDCARYFAHRDGALVVFIGVISVELPPHHRKKCIQAQLMHAVGFPHYSQSQLFQNSTAEIGPDQVLLVRLLYSERLRAGQSHAELRELLSGN